VHRQSTPAVSTCRGVLPLPQVPTAAGTSQIAPPVELMNADSSTAAAIGIVGIAAPECASLRELLRPVGTRVATYATAEQFLLRYRAGRFDCLLVGLSLPRVSGLVLLERLRACGDDVPIVLLAAESDVATAVTAMRAGAADFVERPYTHAALLLRVRRILHDRPRTASR